VIEIDVLAIDARFLQLEVYREQTQKLCEKIHGNIQPTCQNISISNRNKLRETKSINRTLKHLISDT